jgi:hypothetical protein
LIDIVSIIVKPQQGLFCRCNIRIPGMHGAAAWLLRIAGRLTLQKQKPYNVYVFYPFFAWNVCVLDLALDFSLVILINLYIYIK